MYNVAFLAYEGATDQTWTIIILTSKLLQFLGFSYKWILMFLQLVLFALPLSPAWIRQGIYYACSPSIVRGIKYGPNQRNTLDIYLPEIMVPDKRYPVFIFLTGYVQF